MGNTAGVKLTVRGHLTIPSYGQAAVRRIRRSEMDNPWAPKNGRIVNTTEHRQYTLDQPRLGRVLEGGVAEEGPDGRQP